MKRIFCLGFFVLFFLLMGGSVLAYEISDGFFDYGGAEVYFTLSGNKMAIQTGRSGDLRLYPIHHDLLTKRYTSADFEAWVNNGSGWSSTTLVDAVIPYVEIEGLSYATVGNRCLGVFLKNIDSSGQSYFYNDAEIWVFNKEGVVTDNSWLGVTQTSRHDLPYYSSVIRSGSGQLIAGFEYSLDYCELLKEDGSFFNPMCLSNGMTPDGQQLEYVNFGRTSYGGWVFDEGLVSGMRFWSRALYHEDCGAYCQLKTRMPSLAAMSVFTRPEGTYTCNPPAPPGTSVYGYVRCDDFDGEGIPEATVRVSAYNPAWGINVAEGLQKTNINGYWSVNFGSEVNFGQLVLAQETGPYAKVYGSEFPTVPSGSGYTDPDFVNKAGWLGGPQSSIGPYVFYNTDCNLPTPTPTPPPPHLCSTCPQTSVIDMGVNKVGLDGAYRHFVTFSPSDSGMVNELLVKGGVYGGSARSLVCKVTNYEGTVDLSVGGTSVPFFGDQIDQWEKIDFTGNEFYLEKGKNYKIGCRSSEPTLDWNSVYWIANMSDPNMNHKVCSCPLVTPSLDSLVLTNLVGETVVAETGGRNQICDSAYFWEVGAETSNVRKVVFEVMVDNGVDGDDIDDVRVGFTSAGNPDYFRARAYNLASVPAMQFNPVAVRTLVDWFDDDGDTVAGPRTWTVGSKRVVTFPVEFHTDFADDLYDMQVYARNLSGETLAFADGDTARDVRIWDCGVDVTGTFFDASTDGAVLCPDTGFETEADPTVYSSLTFVPDKLMNKIDGGPSYEGTGTSAILLGQDYVTTFTDLITGGFETRLVNLDTGVTSCVAQGFNLTGKVDGYQTDPRVAIDFAAVVDQDSWWQVLDSGVNAKNALENSIPATCAVSGTCRAAAAIGNTSATVGSVGPIFANNLTNLLVCDTCEKVEGKDWYRAGGDIVANNYSYDHLYQNYVYRLGLGVTYAGDTNMTTIVTDTGGTGVVFVAGNVNINQDVVLAADEFFMVVSTQIMNVGPGVDRLDGVYVTDGAFAVNQESDTQLVIRGVIYANSNIRLRRSYVTQGFNNTSPAVRVEYDPSLIFKMPGNLIDPIILWKEGT